MLALLPFQVVCIPISSILFICQFRKILHHRLYGNFLKAYLAKETPYLQSFLGLELSGPTLCTYKKQAQIQRQ